MTDRVLQEIARYVVSPPSFTEEAYRTNLLSLLDVMGCGLLALRYEDPKKRLHPRLLGPRASPGARVPGTRLTLPASQAALAVGLLNRWLDFNDTWLALEWGHPSDNFAALLPLADLLCQEGRSLTLRDLLTAGIQAYEIQGVLSLSTSLNRRGFDHVWFVKIASAALSARLLGGREEAVLSALSHAFTDGGPLRIYRHAPNTGPRKSWAAADAAHRGIFLGTLASLGEPPIGSALTTPTWGFEDVVLGGDELHLAQGLGSYVAENVLFKIAYPAEFHGQTAVEAATRLHPKVAPRLSQVEWIEIRTQESAKRIIDKEGPLTSPADRDHCLQYMVAVALLKGDLCADDYLDEAAADPRIDELRARMRVTEDPEMSRSYLDPERRAIPNAIRVHFQDGTWQEERVDYPLGHRRRRSEGLPLLIAKFRQNTAHILTEEGQEQILSLVDDPGRWQHLPVSSFVDLFQSDAERSDWEGWS